MFTVLQLEMTINLIICGVKEKFEEISCTKMKIQLENDFYYNYTRKKNLNSTLKIH